MAPPKAKFAENEKVLCFHGPLIYEAKCLKVEMKPQLKYFIHYNGWNKNWDEWVPETRVLKCDAQGYQKQKELQKAHLAAKANKKSKTERAKNVEKTAVEKVKTPTVEKKEKAETQPVPATSGSRRGSIRDGTSSRSSTPVSSVPSTPVPPVLPATPSTSTISVSQESSEPKRKRARGDSQPAATVEPEETYIAKVEVRVKIPEDLKPWIVDDWDMITRQYRLLNIPPKKTADQILKDYLKHKTSKGNDDAISEVVQGIKEYFDVMLGAQLLYKFERIQYADILANHPDTPMSEVYGGIHLLRLFVKIGGMLAYTQMDEKSMQTLLGHLHDFLKYLSKNAGDLFSLSDYSVASPEYQRKAI